MKKHPDQLRVEAALKDAMTDETTPILAFRFVLGVYRDALAAQGSGFLVDWPAMAQCLIPQLKYEVNHEYSTTDCRGDGRESGHGESGEKRPL